MLEYSPLSKCEELLSDMPSDRPQEGDSRAILPIRGDIDGFSQDYLRKERKNEWMNTNKSEQMNEHYLHTLPWEWTTDLRSYFREYPDGYEKW